MKIKTRLIILGICAVLFLTVTPYIVLYSLGYRVEFEHAKIVATGGIYVKAMPDGVNINIDNTGKTTTGFLSSYVFEQDLLPGVHSVTIQKAGYFNYQKNLPVTGNEVTKLEHVTLIKQNPAYALLSGTVNNFYVTPDGRNLLATNILPAKINFSLIDIDSQSAAPSQITFSLPVKNGGISQVTWSKDSQMALITINGDNYLAEPFSTTPKISLLPYLSGTQEADFNPNDPQEIFYIKDKNLYTNKNNIALATNTATFKTTNGNLIYLGYDGFLYDYNISQNTTNKVSVVPFSINTNALYQLVINNNTTLLKENTSLFLFNQATGTFDSLYISGNMIGISPNGDKILFYNAHQISYSPLNSAAIIPLLITTYSSNTISNCYWLNDDYIIFSVGNNIMISEVDTRGNVNIVTLPSTITITAQPITIQTPQIYLNPTDKKLYILTQNQLLASERLVP